MVSLAFVLHECPKTATRDIMQEAFRVLKPGVRALYRHVSREEGRLGGGEGTVGIYGSITEASMEKVVQAWERHCGLDREAVMVDVGSGLGRPLLHALASHGIAKAVGIETIRAHEEHYLARAVAAWLAEPAIEILGNVSAERLSIVSFVVARGSFFASRNPRFALFSDYFAKTS